MEDLILEVGKVYVFKDETSKRAWWDNHILNEDYYEMYYREGFRIEDLFHGSGCIGDDVVIDKAEKHLFKKKEDLADEVSVTFTKSDLKDGMLVEVRESCQDTGLYVVIGDYLLNNSGHNDMSLYKEDLTCIEDEPMWDIVKVYTVDPFKTLTLDNLDKILIWERPKEAVVLPTESKPAFEEELLTLKQEARTLFDKITLLEGKIL